jgi:alkylhydroperoxidase family enzyme
LPVDEARQGGRIVREMTDEPRIAPLTGDEIDDDTQALLDRVGLPGGTTMNIFSTLVRHPRLFKRWLPFGGVLLSGSLPARDRELLILRTAQNTGAVYEWTHHVEIAHRVGVEEPEVEQLAQPGEPTDWDAFDAVLVRAADELHADSRIGDATWAALAERYDTEQLIEVPMVVGQYHLVAFTLNSLGVPLEEGFG